MTAVSGESGCGRPKRAATRAAMATGQSIPGAMTPSMPFRLGELPDRGLVLGGHDRALVRVLEAGRLRVAVAGHDEEPALARCAQEPELCRAGP